MVRTITQHLVMGLIIFFAHPLLSQAQERDEFVRIDSIQDVIANWKSNRHLFVKGDIGVSKEQLIKLQAWLAENGPHWTVVLIESANGEAFNAPDGRAYIGMDAVEYALGYGLSNRTAFGEWVHPETGESDGAILALFLKERKFSYFASDAQDRRRLGEANWVGQLDQPAFRAMRNGGRILDAVKDTILHVNGRLESAIRAEAADQQRRADELQRTLAVLQAGLEETKRSIDRVQSLGDQWKREFETATGPMAKPPLAAWRQKILEIESHLEQKDVPAVTQQKASLVTEIDRYLNMYAASADFAAQIRQIDPSVNGYKESPYPVAHQGAKEIEKLMDQAKQERSQGKFEFVETLRKVNQKIGEVGLDVEKEVARIQQEEFNAYLIRSAIWGTTAIFMAIGALVLYILHRRRTPYMLQAVQEIQKREGSIQEETDQIDQLFKRNQTLLGSEDRVKERGYTGRTREVAMQALQYVDDLFIMSKEIRRVLADAKLLVEPTSISSRWLNLFSGRRYQEAIHLVTGAPLEFYTETGIPRILKDIAEQKKVDKNAKDSDAVEVTFEEVYSALDQRGNEAQQRLDLFEVSLTTVAGQLDRLQAEIEGIAASEKKLHTESTADGWFPLPSLMQKVLPALQAELKEADERSGFDAVGAIEGPIAALTQKCVEISRLIQRIEKFREADLSYLEDADNRLATLKYQSSWIGVKLQERATLADDLLGRLLNRSVAAELIDFETSLDKLRILGQNVVALAERIEGELQPSLLSLDQAIQSARLDLATRLQLSADRIFEESEQDPDEHAEQARKDLLAAKAMLNEGEYESASQAASMSVKERELADALVKASLSAVDAFQNKQNEIETRRDLCLKMVGELNDKLSLLSDKFQAEAFKLESANKDAVSDKSASGLLRVIVAECDKLVEASRRASQAMGAGMVLRGADIQGEAIEHIDWLEQQCIRIEEHLQEVESVAAKNVTQFVRQQRESVSWEALRDDRLICDTTLILLSKLQDRIAGLESDIIYGPEVIPSPFETEERLEAFEADIEKMQAAFVADRQAHAEAKRAVEGAARQMVVAQRSVAQSRTDNIPDSPRTSELNREIDALRRELEQLQSDLSVPHHNWHSLDDRAAKLHSNLSRLGQELTAEMETAKNALAAFETASQSVFQAEQWSGPYGLRVTGAPGAQDLERARYGLQTGNYGLVLEISRLAALAAQSAIEQMEREVRRRQTEANRAAEQRRRDRERSNRNSLSSSFSMGRSSGRSSSSRSFGSSSRSTSSSSSRGSSGFSRSGW